jgi:hypothetical protein
MLNHIMKQVQALVFGRKDVAWVYWMAAILWRLFGWISYPFQMKGTMVSGIPAAPPTTSWLKNLTLKLWGWKMGAYFKVKRESAHRGFRVGYIPFPNYDQPSICLSICTEEHVMFKIGHESCRFFAADCDNNEVPLELIGVFPVSDNEIRRARPF